MLSIVLSHALKNSAILNYIMFLIPSTYWIVKKTKDRGRGVFCRKEIEPGTIIGDYIGTVMNPNKVKESPTNFYSMAAGKMSIMPDQKKPGIHLLNHSCSPNCAMHIYKGHTLFFALRRIFVGEELTINYLCKVKYCDAFCKQDECKCSSPVCRGTIHVPERIYASWARYEHDEDEYYKKYIPHKHGTKIALLNTYPASVKDSLAHEIFGHWQKPTHLRAEKTLPPLKEIRQLIRDSGKRLHFKNLHLVINGVSDNQIIGHRI